MRNAHILAASLAAALTACGGGGGGGGGSSAAVSSTPTPAPTPASVSTPTPAPTPAPVPSLTFNSLPTATAVTTLSTDPSTPMCTDTTGAWVYVEAYKSSDVRWCIQPQMWDAHKDDYTKYFGYGEIVVSALTQLYGPPSKLPFVFQVDAITGGAHTGSNFGSGVAVSGDAAYNSFSYKDKNNVQHDIPGFWQYLLTLHEAINVWSGNVSQSWPSDWWADHRSPFPNTIDIQVMKYAGIALNDQTLKDSADAQYYREGDPAVTQNYDSEVGMMTGFFNQYGYFNAYKNGFDLVIGDGMKWDGITKYPSELKTEYVIAYLQLGFRTTQDLTASVFYKNGVGTLDSKTPPYVPDPAKVKAIADAHCSIAGARADSAISTATVNAALANLRKGDYAHAEIASQACTSTAAAKAPAECSCNGTTKKWVAPWSAAAKPTPAPTPAPTISYSAPSTTPAAVCHDSNNNVPDYVEAYKSSLVRWCVEPNLWASYGGYIENASLGYYPYSETFVTTLANLYGVSATASGVPFVIQVDYPSGGAHTGSNFGTGVSVTGDAFYNSYKGVADSSGTQQTIQGFWGYLLSLHEAVNVWAGTVSSGWPTDWWADHRSPFPNSMDYHIMKTIGDAQSNANLQTAAGMQHYRFGVQGQSGYDSEVGMFDTFYANYGGYNPFKNTFSIMGKDGMKWDKLLTTNASQLRTEYVIAYLQLGLGTATDLTKSDFTANGVGSMDVKTPTYTADPNHVKAIADAHCSIAGASSDPGVSAGALSTVLTNLRNGDYAHATISSQSCSLTSPGAAPSECVCDGTSHQWVAPWTAIP